MLNLPTGWYEGLEWWVPMGQAAAVALMIVLGVMAARSLGVHLHRHARARSESRGFR
ncbi:hypothetical protein L2U69_01675 [Zavarzinia compransoris]|uniref:hypothetical protein n=1 Tax=Zavarzinia marina TaxID=2911065 RepID=UPI001F24A384|nr:hypothetical protein [Zavarzinia marina]MCF4164355.1 hypothetical protein [Zavarzinia marina]